MTIAVTSTNPLSKTLYKMRELLAASASFRAAVGAVDADAALASIFIAESAPTLPACLIWCGDDFQRTKVCPGEYGLSMSMEVTFLFKPMDAALSDQDNDTAFLEQIGNIITDCDALAGLGSINGESYLNAEGWSFAVKPGRNKPQEDEGEEFYGATFSVRCTG